MSKVLASGAVRFMLAGALIAALATCFVGRAEASSVFSSPFAAPSVFANSAASGASVVAGDRALTLKWSAVKGAAAYRVSWRGRVLKGGKPTAAWSAKWLGLKVLKASARSYKATGLVNGRRRRAVRTAPGASTSGSTAGPTGGTTATRPTPAV